MSYLSTLDLSLEQLLQPISVENPCGEDIRESSSPVSLYYQIKDARFKARNIERQRADNSDTDDQSKPSWQTVQELAVTALTTKTKDIEIAAWLAEALLRLEGFKGLAFGFNVLRDYVEQFWEPIYPLPEEDGLAARVAPLVGLNGIDTDGTLITPIICLPIVAPHCEPRYAFWHYRQAIEVSRVADEDVRQKRIDSGAAVLDDIETAVAQSSDEFYQGVMGDIQGCLAQYQQLTAALDEKCAQESPPSSKIKNTLEGCLQDMQMLVGERLVMPETNDNPDVPPADAQSSTAEKPVSSSAQIETREQAFQTIEKVMKYFRHHEPHSPLSYMLERVVMWGKLPLPKLLNEIITDDEVRNSYRRLVGIKLEEE